ncbi:MAG TPA: hypothetical protein VIF37_03630 [Methylobacter sp.]|jgi:5-methylcytosine-specific restriction endonuclease McrA
MCDEQKNHPAVRSASEINIQFTEESKALDSQDAEKIRKTVVKHGGDYGGKCFIEKSGLPRLLCTDAKGANRVYINAAPKDKFQDGDKRYINVTAVQKEIGDRIQQPRDAYMHERLKYSDQCLRDYRDNPTVAQDRHIEESMIRRDLPKLKSRKIAVEGITACQYTGESLEKNAAAHHRIRKSDDPSLALDLNNVDIINPKPHKKVHDEGAESPDELRALCEKESWNFPERS